MKSGVIFGSLGNLETNQSRIGTWTKLHNHHIHNHRRHLFIIIITSELNLNWFAIWSAFKWFVFLVFGGFDGGYSGPDGWHLCVCICDSMCVYICIFNSSLQPVAGWSLGGWARPVINARRRQRRGRRAGERTCPICWSVFYTLYYLDYLEILLKFC